ncbi:hypothetical protein M5X11_10230 [Paenibacillus alginolyticus]|uniref:Uncharacterized protein n=1 Tax=Paenibacillus alginolyticus TaxID=59839 RepID=A0ABT4G5I7_9BACL|nr:hypothetical protein [Paenibacillus alginolyticus]MCY9665337.1 hypothetical protein [Paenibacillus alginolyticus]MCY9691441.1 hypothetical protein [Paenibacillus alginolyticus]MEC0146549.1 hypothetical protein [Paenibacillus alginolyticus]
MKKILICLFVLLLALPVSSAFAKLYVYDVTADSLSVRTGPSPVYTKIATLYKGADVVETCQYSSNGSCKVDTTYNGVSFRMEKMYYPDSSVGSYSSLVTGWIARKEGSVEYISVNNVAKVSKTGGTPSDYGGYNPSLVYPSSTLVPNGSDVYSISQDKIYAEDTNPNAWVMMNWVGSGVNTVHMNGWHLNAYAY